MSLSKISIILTAFNKIISALLAFVNKSSYFYRYLSRQYLIVIGPINVIIYNVYTSMCNEYNTQFFNKIIKSATKQNTKQDYKQTYILY